MSGPERGPEQGKFITFEGGEGGGKSTQVKTLAAALQDAGHTVVVTREPGGAPAAEEIRDLLVSGAVERWSPMAEVLLNYAAREMHVRQTIRPALDRGDWVISDRFSDSTMAYQGYGGGVDPARIEAIHTAVLGEFKPDLTLILDLDVTDGLARAGKRLVEAGSAEDRFERMERDFHHRLRDGFLEIAKSEPLRCRVIDASGDITAVAENVRRTVSEVLGVSLP
ncbi:MAG: dTMP kinase [Rhodospirillales bacterium]|nr:dTMP kinase [Rhodospirillales bacterium]MBO6786872.1 dTMP kinase [Rhodospirillales bacterium]